MSELDWKLFPKGMSVIIPVYNEKNTIKEIIRRVRATKLVKQIVLVDDFSTDGTREILEELKKSGETDLTIDFHSENKGKGAAVRTAITHAVGDILLIQDADLEYDPVDYPTLLLSLIHI